MFAGSNRQILILRESGRSLNVLLQGGFQKGPECALRNVRRPPGAEQCWPKPEGCRTALPCWGRQPRTVSTAAGPVGSLAHIPHFSHRAESPRVDLATMMLLGQRPCRMIAESGAPARVRAIRPAWLEIPTPRS